MSEQKYNEKLEVLKAILNFISEYSNFQIYGGVVRDIFARTCGLLPKLKDCKNYEWFNNKESDIDISFDRPPWTPLINQKINAIYESFEYFMKHHYSKYFTLDKYTYQRSKYPNVTQTTSYQILNKDNKFIVKIDVSVKTIDSRIDLDVNALVFNSKGIISGDIVTSFMEIRKSIDNKQFKILDNEHKDKKINLGYLKRVVKMIKRGWTCLNFKGFCKANEDVGEKIKSQIRGYELDFDQTSRLFGIDALFLALAREYDATSLFHEDHLPWDMFRLIIRLIIGDN